MPRAPKERNTRSTRSSRKKEDNDHPVTRGKKKRASDTSVEQPKLKKKAADGRDIDNYCWSCHELGQDKVCSSCPRVYHSTCVKKAPFSESGLCFQCRTKSVVGTIDSPKIGRLELKELLKFALQEAIKEGKKQKQYQAVEDSKFCKFFKTLPVRDIKKNLCHIDLDTLIDKINDDPPYLSTSEFYSDVKWIFHNCCIMYGKHSEITEAAQKLEKNFRQELVDIEACPECYANKHSEDYLPSDFFTNVCKNPHEIVWAKLRGSPFWPAKCMKTFNGHADVRFFGTHDKSTVPVNQCFKISQKSPNGRDIKQHKYLDAVGELSIYIKNYITRHSVFPYSNPKTPLDASPSKNSRRNLKKGNKQKVHNESEEANDLSPSLQARGETSTVVSSAFVQNEIPESNRILHSQPVLPRASSPVAVCMTFTTDDEVSANEVGDQDQLLNSSEYLPVSETNIGPSVQSCVSLSGSHILQSEDPMAGIPTVLEMSNHIETASNNFLNAKSLDIPVITSVSKCLNSMSFEHSVFANAITESLAAAGPSNNASTNESSANFLDANNYGFQNVPQTMMDDDAEDDIEVVDEKPGNTQTVNRILDNSRHVEILCQTIVKNHPTLREFYKTCRDFGILSFLRLWLSIHVKRTEESEISTFFNIYTQMASKISALETRVKQLRAGDKNHTENIQALVEENSRLKKIKNFLEIKVKNFCAEIDQRNVDATLLLKALRKKYEHTSYLESNILADKKIQSASIEYEAVIRMKDEELEKCISIINELNAKACQESNFTIGSQTDLTGEKIYTQCEVDEIQRKMKDIETKYNKLQAQFDNDHGRQQIVEFTQTEFEIEETTNQHTFVALLPPPPFGINVPGPSTMPMPSSACMHGISGFSVTQSSPKSERHFQAKIPKRKKH